MSLLDGPLSLAGDRPPSAGLEKVPAGGRGELTVRWRAGGPGWRGTDRRRGPSERDGPSPAGRRAALVTLETLATLYAGHVSSHALL